MTPDGKAAVITGSSSGIGPGIAEARATRGPGVLNSNPETATPIRRRTPEEDHARAGRLVAEHGVEADAAGQAE